MTAAQSISPPPLFRARPDLQCVRQQHGHREYWAVCDPVTQRFYLLRDEEHAVLRLLAQRRSVEELCSLYSAQVAARPLTRDRALQFLAQLHRDGLIISSGANQGDCLRHRAMATNRREQLHTWTNLLCIRTPGWNPDRLFTALHARLSFVFRPWLQWAGLLLIGLALGSLLLSWGAATERLGAWEDLWTWQNMGWLLATATIVKVLHELAHGLTCKHFGCEVPELGVLWLVGLPCLYCDVSDTWRLRQPWQRIWVSAAGIWCELLLAAIATFVWWAASPGWVRMLSGHVMLVCGLSTILVNGNPLLRYDGYFILSDLWGIPNLSQRANRALALWVKVYFRRAVAPSWLDDVRAPRALVLYALFAWVYRVVLLLTILWCAYQMLTRNGWGFLWPPLVVSLAIGWLSRVQAWAASKRDLFEGSTRWTLLARSLPPVGLVLLLSLWPLPQVIQGSATIDAPQAQTVYATVPGFVTQAVRPGTHVRQGDVLLRLSNTSIDYSRLQAEGDVRWQTLHVETLRRRRTTDVDARRQLPLARTELVDRERRREAVDAEAERLVVRAPCAGQVWPLPMNFTGPSARAFAGVFDQQKHWLAAETPVCLVGDGTREAVVLVEGRTRPWVRIGQAVRVHVTGYPTMLGQVKDLERQRLDRRVPDAESASRGAPRTEEMVAVRVALRGSTEYLTTGLTGHARIESLPRPLAGRLLDFLLFHFGRAST